MKSYNKIIFVGESGTCRAPMAAGILKDIARRNNREILSRGLVVLFPEPLNQKAEAVMISNGLSTEGYVSCALSEEDFQGEPLVLVMENRQRQKVLELFPEADPEDVQVLTEFVGDELEIVNPYGGALQLYGLCYETLFSSIGKLVSMLDGGE